MIGEIISVSSIDLHDIELCDSDILLIEYDVNKEIKLSNRIANKRYKSMLKSQNNKVHKGNVRAIRNRNQLKYKFKKEIV